MSRRATRLFNFLYRRAPSDYAWNAVAFGLDSSLFAVGMSLLGSTTILPALISRLTDSTVAVGLASGIVSGAWLLPQLLVASAIAGRPRKKPVMVAGAWVSRPIFLLVALVILLFAEKSPLLTTVFLLAALLVFFLLDGVVSTPWFDVLARAIPPRRRGRVIGIAQVLGGLGGMAAGVGVRYVLSDTSPWSFPENHALIMAASSVVLLASAVGITLIREPAPTIASNSMPLTLGQVIRGIPTILRTDRPFVRLVGVRIITGWVTVASAFFVLHAVDVGGLPLAQTGLLVSAQVSGSLAAGLMMTVMQDHLGPRAHIRAVIAVAALPPLIVLAASPYLAGLGEASLHVYLVTFFLLGLSLSSLGWPFLNYVLEYAPEDRRTMYIGIVNTLAAFVMLAPPFGGWVVRSVSYSAVFALAAAFAGVGLVLSVRLPCTRREAAHRASGADGQAEPGTTAPT